MFYPTAFPYIRVLQNIRKNGTGVPHKLVKECANDLQGVLHPLVWFTWQILLKIVSERVIVDYSECFLTSKCIITWYRTMSSGQCTV